MPAGGSSRHNQPLCPGGGKSLLPQPGQPPKLRAEGELGSQRGRAALRRGSRARPGRQPRERRQRCRSTGRGQVRSRRKGGSGRGGALRGQPLCLCCRWPPRAGPAAGRPGPPEERPGSPEEPRRRPAAAAAAAAPAAAAAAGGRQARGAGDERQQSVATHGDRLPASARRWGGQCWRGGGGGEGKAVLQPPRGRAPRCGPGAVRSPQPRPLVFIAQDGLTPLRRGWGPRLAARAAQAVAVPGEKERGC